MPGFHLSALKPIWSFLTWLPVAWLAHILGVPLAVEYDVAAAPMAVRLLGAEGEVTAADFVLKLIQELGLQEG